MEAPSTVGRWLPHLDGPSLPVRHPGSSLVRPGAVFDGEMRHPAPQRPGHALRHHGVHVPDAPEVDLQSARKER